MAIFGSRRDITFFKGITNEFTNNVLSQQCGYYKIVLKDTDANVYGESLKKTYIGPVLLNALIRRDDVSTRREEYGPNIGKSIVFNFLKDDLVTANVYPEIGDIVMYNEDYYEVDSLDENQLIYGKDNEYAYSDGLDNFGDSYSIILTAHYVSPDKLNIAKQRL